MSVGLKANVDGTSGAVQVNGNDVVTVNSSGNVGVGTTSPGAKLDVSGAVRSTGNFLGSTGTSGFVSLSTETNVANGGSIVGRSATSSYNTAGVELYAGGSERMRIDSAGNVLVGTTTSTGIFNGSSTNPGIGLEPGGSITAQRNNGTNLYLAKATGYTVADFVSFYVAGVYRGGIYYNSGTTQIVYAVTSDYRAKDIIGPVENTGATIDALKVYTGQMHGATMAYPMMVAHEAQEVVPFAVSGEKDAVNEDGTPKYQQMDHAILVPLLIAELQSVRARVAALEAK